LEVEALEERCVLTTAGSSVVFLGDSILDFYGHGPGFASWNSQLAPLGASDLAVAGSRTVDVLQRLNEGQLSGLTPKVVVLLIGTNDLFAGATPAAAAQGIVSDLTAIRTLEPQAQILLLGLLPRGQDNGNPLRSLISQTNQLLAPLGSLPNIHYLDIGGDFLQPDGTISPAIMPDYLHPSAQGYAIMTAALEGPLQQLLAPPQANIATATDPSDLLPAAPATTAPLQKTTSPQSSALPVVLLASPLGHSFSGTTSVANTVSQLPPQNLAVSSTQAVDQLFVSLLQSQQDANNTGVRTANAPADSGPVLDGLTPVL
jgi:lysophospholipase L1-like esterase